MLVNKSFLLYSNDIFTLLVIKEVDIFIGVDQNSLLLNHHLVKIYKTIFFKGL